MKKQIRLSKGLTRGFICSLFFSLFILSHLFNIDAKGKFTVRDCLDIEWKLEGGKCVSKCPKGSYKIVEQRKCVSECSDGYRLKDGTKDECVPTVIYGNMTVENAYLELITKLNGLTKEQAESIKFEKTLETLLKADLKIKSINFHQDLTTEAFSIDIIFPETLRKDLKSVLTLEKYQPQETEFSILKSYKIFKRFLINYLKDETQSKTKDNRDQEIARVLKEKLYGPINKEVYQEVTKEGFEFKESEHLLSHFIFNHEKIKQIDGEETEEAFQKRVQEKIHQYNMHVVYYPNEWPENEDFIVRAIYTDKNIFFSNVKSDPPFQIDEKQYPMAKEYTTTKIEQLMLADIKSLKTDPTEAGSMKITLNVEEPSVFEYGLVLLGISVTMVKPDDYQYDDHYLLNEENYIAEFWKRENKFLKRILEILKKSGTEELVNLSENADEGTLELALYRLLNRKELNRPNTALKNLNGDHILKDGQLYKMPAIRILYQFKDGAILNKDRTYFLLERPSLGSTIEAQTAYKSLVPYLTVYKETDSVTLGHHIIIEKSGKGSNEITGDNIEAIKTDSAFIGIEEKNDLDEPKFKIQALNSLNIMNPISFMAITPESKELSYRGILLEASEDNQPLEEKNRLPIIALLKLGKFIEERVDNSFQEEKKDFHLITFIKAIEGLIGQKINREGINRFDFSSLQDEKRIIKMIKTSTQQKESLKRLGKRIVFLISQIGRDEN